MLFEVMTALNKWTDGHVIKIWALELHALTTAGVPQLPPTHSTSTPFVRQLLAAQGVFPRSHTAVSSQVLKKMVSCGSSCLRTGTLVRSGSKKMAKSAGLVYSRGLPTPGPQTVNGLWPVGYQATQAAGQGCETSWSQEGWGPLVYRVVEVLACRVAKMAELGLPRVQGLCTVLLSSIVQSGFLAHCNSGTSKSSRVCVPGSPFGQALQSTKELPGTPQI